MLEPAYSWTEDSPSWMPPQMNTALPQSSQWTVDPLLVPSVFPQENLYPSYVPVSYYDPTVYDNTNIYSSPLGPVGVSKPGPASSFDGPQLSVHAEDFIPIAPMDWSSLQMAIPIQPGTSPIHGIPPAIEEQLNSQSLYKTELCRSFEETGTCRYGVKCQFAHGKDELRPVLRHPKYKTEICRTFHNSGSCPYGKRCRFIHLSADEGNLNSINIIPWTRAPEEGDPVFPESEETVSEFDVDEVASKMRSLDMASDSKAKAKGKNPNRKPKGQRRKTPNKKKSVSFEEPPSSPSSLPNPSVKQNRDKKANNRRLAFFARLSGDTTTTTASTPQNGNHSA
jgi:butyrate response factor 1